MTERALIESPIKQGSDERIAYVIPSTAAWGNAPSDVSVKIYDTNRTDLSLTCLLGLPIVEGNKITTPIVHSLTAGKVYRLEIKFTISGNVVETYTVINAEH